MIIVRLGGWRINKAQFHSTTRSVYSKALLALAVCLAGCDLELKFQEIHFHNPIRTAPVLSLNQLSNAEWSLRGEKRNKSGESLAKKANWAAICNTQP